MLIDLRLGTREAADVNGFPYNRKTGEVDVVNVDGTEVVIFKQVMDFTSPAWFPVSEENIYYILFLDELTNTNTSTQHAAYGLVLDRMINNGEILPLQTAVIGAGNLKEDKTGAKPLLPAFANRFGMHLRIRTEPHAAISYMTERGFNRSIIGFLNWRPNKVFHKSEGEDAFATGRSWSFANSHMNNTFMTQEQKLIAVAGAVGSDIAYEFAGFLEYEGRLPDFGAIRRGEVDYTFPVGEEGLKFAAVNTLAFELIESMQLDNADDALLQTDNLCKLVSQLPSEMHILLFRTLSSDKNAVVRLFKFPTLRENYAKVAKHISKLRK